MIWDKLILIILIVGVIIGSIIVVLNSKTVNEELKKIGMDGQIIILAIGLIVTSVATGIGLYFTTIENKSARNEKNLSMVGNFTAQVSNLKDKDGL